MWSRRGGVPTAPARRSKGPHDVDRVGRQQLEVSSRPYAPLPTSSRPTALRLGSYFQRRPRLVQAVSLLAVLIGVTYLTWRAIVTSPGVPPPLFWPLWVAEAWGFVAVLVLMLDAWRLDPTPRPSPLDLPVDVVIATYDEDLDIVEPTLIGALRMRGDVRVHLCDDGRRPEMAALARLHGVRYVTRPDNLGAKAGNINAVLPSLTGVLLLVLDADHVPSPDFLEATSGYFVDPQVAVVQTAHSFRNHNSVMHDEEGRHEQSLFFDVLLPGRNRLDSVFWAGSAALLRTAALREVGGLSTRTSTEDFETSLLLQRAGYRLRYHNEHLIQGLAPDNLAAYLTQRARWAEGTLASYRPGHRNAWGRHLRLRQRASYTGGLLYYLTPIQRLIFTSYVVVVGGFGLLPVGNLDGAAEFLGFWGAWTAASLLAVNALERGSTRPSEGARNLFVAMEAFLRAVPSLWRDTPAVFKVTPKNEVDLGGWDAVRFLRLPLALAAVTAIVLALRWTDTVLDMLDRATFLPPVPPFALSVLTVFGLFEVAVIVRFARRTWVRRQYRELWRFPVALPARFAGRAARCMDLHQRGAAIAVDVSDLPELLRGVLDDAATRGRAGRGSAQDASTLADVGSFPIELELALADGTVSVARGSLSPRSMVLIGDGAARVGGSVQWDDRASREAVIERCYVVEPYGARRAFLQRRAPRYRVQLRAKVHGLRARTVDVSEVGAAFELRRGDLRSGVPVDVELRLRDGRTAHGRFRALNRSVTDRGVRVGGEMEWRETDWLATLPHPD
jgi:cellulose synthase (UDP-forming)